VQAGLSQEAELYFVVVVLMSSVGVLRRSTESEACCSPTSIVDHCRPRGAPLALVLPVNRAFTRADEGESERR
jgi:hypothetical protein